MAAVRTRMKEEQGEERKKDKQVEEQDEERERTKKERKRMKQEQEEERKRTKQEEILKGDADKKFKEFTLTFRHRASKILKKIKKVPQEKVFTVYVEEFWQIWREIYMKNTVKALHRYPDIKCTNGMLAGKKPSGIQQLFCTWMKCMYINMLCISALNRPCIRFQRSGRVQSRLRE